MRSGSRSRTAAEGKGTKKAPTRGRRAAADADQSPISRREALIAGFGGLAVAGVAIDLSGRSGEEQVEAEPTALPTVVAGATRIDEDLRPGQKGSPDAPVTLLDFSSYTCGHCARFAIDTEPLIDERYVATGRVLFTFMHFPLNSGAHRASLAVESAGAQGAFWGYHRELMLRQDEGIASQYSDDWLGSLATGLRLDVDRFLVDLSSRGFEERVADAQREGERRGVRATPTFFINGVTVVGARPFEDFRKAIDEALSRAGNE